LHFDINREIVSQGEVGMILKILTTLILLDLGISAFWSDALGAGTFFNPVWVIFFLLAAIVWFTWKPISNAFKSAKEESNIPILRMGSKIIGGMASPPPKRPHSDEPT
jgi:hypothetical protein